MYTCRDVILPDKKDFLRRHPEFNKDKLFDIPFYEQLNFHKALVLNSLKEYKKSMLIFKQLHKYFPNNDRYLNWIDSLRITKYDINSIIWLGITFIIIILRIPLKKWDLALYDISFYLLNIVFLFAIIFLIKRWILAIRKRKK